MVPRPDSDSPGRAASRAHSVRTRKRFRLSVRRTSFSAIANDFSQFFAARSNWPVSLLSKVGSGLFRLPAFGLNQAKVQVNLCLIVTILDHSGVLSDELVDESAALLEVGFRQAQ